MSDYEDEEFDNYEEEDFEEEAEEDYDVLPTKSPVQGSGTPMEIQSPVLPSRGPVRTSYAGDRPPSANFSPILSRPMSRGGAGSAVQAASSPLMGLTDAQRRAAIIKLKAAREKLSKVSLCEVAIDDLFVSAPLSQAELAAMGRSCYAGLKVASSQTHEDDKEEECQTMEISTRSYQCQVPDDRNTASADPATQAIAGGKAVMRVIQTDPEQETKLMAFMRWAGPTLLAALGVNPSVRKLAIPMSKESSAATSGLPAGSVRLAHEALLGQRPVSCADYSGGPEPLLLAAYGAVGAQLGAEALLQDHTINTKGVMVVWDLAAPTKPKAVLVSEGSPACCTWAPGPGPMASRLAFAGMEEGGVCAWDLDEPEGRHTVEAVAGQSVLTRRPSYSTEFQADVISSAAPIVALATLAKGDNRSRPCQLVSLSAWGQVTVYTVSISAESEREGGDGDLGLRPGSKVRLVRTASNVRFGMDVLRPPPAKMPAPTMDQMVMTSDLQLLPGSHQFVVGADGGRVLRGSWVGVPPAPKEYVCADRKALSAMAAAAAAARGGANGTSKGDKAAAAVAAAGARGVRSASTVTSVHVSSFCASAFLAGHDNGTVVLHNVDTAAAACVWPDAASGAVAVVRWSPSRPCVFFVLDKMCTLYCWDLAKSRTAAVSAQAVVTQDPGRPAPSLPTYFDASIMHTGESGMEGKRASYCIGYDDGNVDVHVFTANLATPVQGEMSVLLDLLGAPPSSGKQQGAAVAKAAKK